MTTTPELIDPATTIAGPLLVLAPHSDDETLGCGATIARLAPTVPVHVAYGTDGRLSPIGPDDKAAPDTQTLVALRQTEAQEAMALLGVPVEQLHFLGLPDGRLNAEQARLTSAIEDLIDRLCPRTVMAPFRYDQHPDHLAMHRAAVALLRSRADIQLLQYFVYYRYPLLAEPDIRKWVAPEHCIGVDMAPVRVRKRQALDCYRSQVTCHFPWQQRPCLMPAILDDHCAGIEQFVTAPPDLADHALFTADLLRLRLNLRYGPQAVLWKKRLLG